ncbi:MAG: hypothetical protein WC683_09545 [bacterium]|jgi:hypothetical protein
MNTNKSPVDTYKAARADGKGTSDACRAVLAAHPGISFDDVVEMSWQVETGKPSPKWQHEDGTPTAACMAWDRGAEKKTGGE